MPSAGVGSEPVGTERRRSSLAKSAASLQSKLASFKLNKDRSRNTKDQHRSPRACEVDGQSQDPLARERSTTHLLAYLPPELASQILLLLDAQSLFALRAACVSFASLVSLHQYDLARHHIAQTLPKSCIPLYDKPPFDLNSLYRVCHAQAIATSLAGSLADFVETEYLRMSSRRSRLAFCHSRARLISRVTPHLLTLNHFYTTWRQWMLQRYPKDENNGWSGYNQQTGCVSISDSRRLDMESSLRPTEVVKQMMRESYTPKQLRDAHQTCVFLNQALTRMLRAPTYATAVEKTLRGWNGKPPPREDVEALFAIGGPEQVRRVLSSRSLSERWAEVERWVASLQKTQNIKWRENWIDMVYGPMDRPGPDEAGSDFQPPDNFSSRGFGHVWFQPFMDLWVESDSLRFWRPKPSRRFVSEMIGRDILSGTRWEMDIYVSEDEDEEEALDDLPGRQVEEARGSFGQIIA